MHYDEIRRVVSDGAYALLKLGFGVERDHPDTEQLRQELLDYYLKDLSSETHPFPGITELIEKINENDLRWGIVTNKPWAYTEPLMKRFEFAETSSCIICPDHVSERKPRLKACYSLATKRTVKRLTPFTSATIVVTLNAASAPTCQPLPSVTGIFHRKMTIDTGAPITSWNPGTNYGAS